jgi:calcium binding protein 39
MIKYISSKHNLKTIMNLLRATSLNIQLEAFQVFKVFVVNPKKSVEVSSILYKNKGKMIPFLEAFHMVYINITYLFIYILYICIFY